MLRILTILVVLACFVVTHPQGKHHKFDPEKYEGESPKSILVKVEEGFNGGDVEKFAKYFSSQTYASLSNGVSGYYSPNQFFYILQNYFSIYKPIGFRFIVMNDKGENPYASGLYKFEAKGIRGNAQVFISLKIISNIWKISQITIN
ncbi:MAG: DUF4783 domain-containing protein [Ignavibacteriales bacterium]|nr:DUF4783 domain-containing protein [Ignavibacteriales bacterium]